VTEELGSNVYGLANRSNHDLVPLFLTSETRNKMGLRVVYEDRLLSILKVQGMASTHASYKPSDSRKDNGTKVSFKNITAGYTEYIIHTDARIFTLLPPSVLS
jgi:hypothetical protein